MWNGYIYIYYVINIQDLTRRKITPGIDWDGLEELKVKSWPTFGSRRKTSRSPQAPPVSVHYKITLGVTPRVTPLARVTPRVIDYSWSNSRLSGGVIEE